MDTLWRSFWHWLTFALIANILALPQFYPYLNRLSASRAKFVQAVPIWVGRQIEPNLLPPMALWWRGLGVFAAISLVFGWIAILPRQVSLYLPALVVFLIANVIRYQPWELDNTKVFYDGWIPVALPVVSQFLVALVKPKKILGYVFFAALLGAACLSALISSWQGLFSPTALFDRSDYQFGLWLAENSPPNSVVLMLPDSTTPISVVAGRQLFYGYAGWVDSHGMDTSRFLQFEKLFRNPNNPQLFRASNVTYAIPLNKRVGREFAKSPHWTLAYSDHTRQIYRLF
jgi:hypothetical protein